MVKSTKEKKRMIKKKYVKVDKKIFCNFLHIHMFDKPNNDAFVYLCEKELTNIDNLDEIVKPYLDWSGRIMNKEHDLVITDVGFFEDEKLVGKIISLIGQKNCITMKHNAMTLGITCDCTLLHPCKNVKESDKPVESIVDYGQLLPYTFGRWSSMTVKQQDIVKKYYAYQIYMYRKE